MQLIGSRPSHDKYLRFCCMRRSAQVMSHRHAGPAFLWQASMYVVQNTWTWHGTDYFLELMFSEELEGLAAL